jgi:hypothetical protein
VAHGGEIFALLAFCFGYDTNDLEKWGDFWSVMQKAWREFIEKNRQALRDGKQFEIGKPPLTRKMFPPKFYFHREGRPDWPDWSKPADNVPPKWHP